MLAKNDPLRVTQPELAALEWTVAQAATCRVQYKDEPASLKQFDIMIADAKNGMKRLHAIYRDQRKKN